MGQESQKGDSGIKSGHTTVMMSEGQAGCMAQESFVLDKVRVSHPVCIAMVLGMFVAGRQISWIDVCRLSHHPDMNL